MNTSLRIPDASGTVVPVPWLKLYAATSPVGVDVPFNVMTATCPDTPDLPEPSNARAKPWPWRYAARRVAWHALDHAWEIEDKSS